MRRSENRASTQQFHMRYHWKPYSRSAGSWSRKLGVGERQTIRRVQTGFGRCRRAAIEDGGYAAAPKGPTADQGDSGGMLPKN